MVAVPNLSVEPNITTNGPSSPALIRAVALRKVYRTAAGDFEALKSVNLAVYPGELLTIVGKSGAGKTTLINLLSGVDRITSGEVWFGDQAVHRMSENDLVTWRGRSLGMIYQSFYLMPDLNLVQNVMLPIDFCGDYDAKRSKARALELLTLVELERHAYKVPSEISGGQQQRVAIARALANDPTLIVADEPTGRLDSITAELIFKLFENLVAQGKTVLMVTHDHNFARRSTRTLEIVDGRILGQTPVPGADAEKA